MAAAATALEKIPVSDTFLTSMRNCQRRFDEKVEDQFRWLQEILETAREQFQKPGVAFLPKTPQKNGGKRNQQRGKLESLNSTAPSIARATRAASRKNLDMELEEENLQSASSRALKPAKQQTVVFGDSSVVAKKNSNDKADGVAGRNIEHSGAKKRTFSDDDSFKDAVESPAKILRQEPSGSQVEQLKEDSKSESVYFSPPKEPVADESKYAEPKQRLSKLNRESRAIRKKSSLRKRSSVLNQQKLAMGVEQIEIEKHADEDIVEPSPQKQCPRSRTRARTKQKRMETEQEKKPVPESSVRKDSPSPRKERMQTPDKSLTKEKGTAHTSPAGGRSATRSRLRNHVNTTGAKSPTRYPEAMKNLRTPSPSKKLPDPRVHTSGNKDHSGGAPSPHNVVTGIATFLKRNTPQKQSQKQQEDLAREKLLLAQKKEKEALLKKDELLKLKIEESKRKREERAMRVAEAKKQGEQKMEEKRIKLQEKHNSHTKLKDMESDTQKKKQIRAETRKRLEEEERAKKDAEEKARRDEARAKEAKEKERKEKEQKRMEREQEELKRLKEKEAKREEMLRIQREEERERMMQEEREEQEKSKLEKELKSAIKKHNLSTAKPTDESKGKQSSKGSRGTFNVSQPNVSTNGTESYDMTPLREKKPSTDTNYDIEDLHSGDETDDEENPRKKIPLWAQGAQLKAALIRQHYSPPETDGLFGIIFAPELSEMFQQQRKRFHKRTSSAQWDSPLMKRPALAKDSSGM